MEPLEEDHQMDHIMNPQEEDFLGILETHLYL
jgi:hypothetical protein